MKKQLSVIIPAFDEENNILPLMQRLDIAMKEGGIEYEVIFVDDRSTDKTAERIKQLQNIYPVYYQKKIGKQGKAFSLLEGIPRAKFPNVAIIDADLQYPPEYLPVMLDMLDIGWDVVVGDRKERGTDPVRKIASYVFKYIFAKLLHGLDLDTQSGLKVFRKEVYYRTNIEPSPWTFDLDFLLQSRNAGYKITSYPINLDERLSGRTKVKTLKAAWEIGWTAIKTKLKPVRVAPLTPLIGQKGGSAVEGGFHYKGKKYLHFSTLSLKQSAFFSLTRRQKRTILLLLVLIALLLFINWHATLTLAFAVIVFFYFVDLIYYVFLIGKSYQINPEIKIGNGEIRRLKGKNLPLYTILCPLYKEGEVLPQFVEAIKKLDYPKDKLQVLLLLERDDEVTISRANNLNLPSYFEIIEVPRSQPKTKPKACNYGLIKAKGEFCVIYDAEDVPEPLQLKKALLAFRKTVGVECIQAKLNFYNTRQNTLTRLFSKEYGLWFELVLTGLQAINAPIPLGGTSNHFRTNTVKELGGWDAFNVTEDCDLGMRLAINNMRTAIVDSITYEEANSNLKNWFNQRTRWVKGYIQTYFVHMRDWRNGFNSFSNLINFQFIVGGKVMLTLINPLMWLMTISYFSLRGVAGDFIESLFPPVIFYMGVTSMVVGNFIYFYNYMIAAVKRKEYWLIKYAFLVPFYWLLMSAASWAAVYGLMVKPHYWFKTKHGLHLNKLAIRNNSLDLSPVATSS
jgi:glycosyltransferase XagB